MWSRSTKAWRFNDEGYLREVPSGCAVFDGARMVYNTVRTASEDFSNSAWAKNALTTPSANTLLCANATSSQNLAQGGTFLAVTTGQTFVYGIRAQYVTDGVTHLQISANGNGFGFSQYLTVSLLDGSFNAVGCTGSVTLVSPGVYDITQKITATASGNYDGFTIGLANSLSDTRFQAFVGDGVKSVTLLRAWSVDVTSRDASYVPEYVSVGSTVGKNFFIYTDDFSQSAWSKTNVTITQAAVANPVNGRIDAQKVEATATSATTFIQDASSSGSSAGNILVIYIKQGSGATDANFFYVRNLTTLTNRLGISFNYSTGAITYVTGSTGASVEALPNGWWKLQMVVTSGISNGDNLRAYIGFSGGTETAGEYFYAYRPYLGQGTTAPNVITAVGNTWDPHGSGVDGVKYFSTDYTKNSALTSLNGLRREIAATNGLAYSRNLSSGVYAAPVITGTPELLTNGDFSSGSTGWSVSGTDATHIATFSGGTLRFQSDTTTPALTISQPNVMTVGETYTATFTLSSYTSGLLKSDYFNLAPVVSSTTSLTRTITGVAVSTSFGFTRSTTNVDVTLDSISLKLAAVTLAQDATGLDGIANTATTITARQNDATLLQTINSASADRCSSAYVRRKTGTGSIWFTQDGGSSWTDITSQINSSTYTRVQITSNVTNASVGFKISTSGDAIEVDNVQNEAGVIATSPIVTTTAIVTRNLDSLTYQTSGNIDFATGTCFSRFMSSGSLTSRFSVSLTNGYSYINSAGANTAWATYDGTTIVTKTGLDDMTSKTVNRIVAWGDTTQKVTGNGLAPASGAFDGSWGSGTIITIGNTIGGTIKDVAIYPTKFSDAQMQAVTK